MRDRKSPNRFASCFQSPLGATYMFNNLTCIRFHDASAFFRHSITVFTILAIFSFSVISVNAASFPGTNTGAIADGISNGTCGTSRDVQFAVTGVSAPITQVSVNFTGTHTYVGDIHLTLIAPNGTSLFLMHRVGRATNGTSNYGDSSNLGGTYVFSDAGTLNMWTQATGGASDYNIPSGVYRSQPSGIGSPVATGPAVTSMNSAFAGVPNPNGNWILRFQDCMSSDTGAVSAAGLTLNAAPTSANVIVGGRAVSSSGRGLASVMVTISGGNLESPITRMTNPFGFYRFDEIPAGQTYVLSAGSKRHFFVEPVRIITLHDSIFNFDFISDDPPSMDSVDH